jgi:hypothetical protein
MGDETAFAARKIRKFGTQSGTVLIPIERGVSDLSSRRWRHCPSSSQPAPTSVALLFSLKGDGAVVDFCRYAIRERQAPVNCSRSVTDAGTRSGRRNKLISAGRNPQSWVVHLHLIGSSVLPAHLIHPTAYTVVVYQIQGSACAFHRVRLVCTPFPSLSWLTGRCG